MADRVIHISEEEAARNFAEVLARVRAGAEVVIDGHEPIVVVARPTNRNRDGCFPNLSRLAETHGSTVTLDVDFARYLEAIISSHREPLNPSTWD